MLILFKRVLACAACALTALAAGAIGEAASNAPPMEPWPAFVDVSERLLGPPARWVADFGPFWLDMNGDEWLDLIFMNHGWHPLILVNQQGTRLVDARKESGIRSTEWLYPEHSDRHGGSCADYDNDGDVDLFFAHGAKLGETLGKKYDELLNNSGQGTFREISHEAGVLNSEGRSRHGSWGDYDRDGKLDLYIGNYASPNLLYRNNGDGTFSDVTEKAGVALVEPTRQTWIDYDNDGELDLLMVWQLRMFRNRGDGTFSETTHELGLDRDPVKAPYALALADYDNDGDTDFFVVSRRFQSTLFRNDGKVFTSIPGSFGHEPEEEGAGAVWGDVDNDGDQDLVLASSRRIRLFANVAGQLVERRFDLGPEIVLGESDVALGDYDNDGRLDLAVNGTKRHHLFHNVTTGGSWLKLSFVGHTSNRMGIGVKVWISSSTAGEAAPRQLAYQEYVGDTGFFGSAGCGPMHIGLGDQSAVNVRVWWPSGKESRLENVSVNQQLRIEEPTTESAGASAQ